MDDKNITIYNCLQYVLQVRAGQFNIQTTTSPSNLYVWGGGGGCRYVLSPTYFPIVSLERGVISCAESQVFSCYRGWKEACQATRAISTTSRRELSTSLFTFPPVLHTVHPVYLLCTSLHILQAVLTCNMFIVDHILFYYPTVNLNQQVWCDYRHIWTITVRVLVLEDIKLNTATFWWPKHAADHNAIKLHLQN